MKHEKHAIQYYTPYNYYMLYKYYILLHECVPCQSYMGIPNGLQWTDEHVSSMHIVANATFTTCGLWITPSIC